MKKQPFSLIVPVYNEEKGIKKFLNELIEAKGEGNWPCEIVVVNDGSSDKTAEIIESFENIIILNHQENRGYGAALKTAIKSAKNENIIIIDGDGTYPIEKIEELSEVLEDYDMIVGARNGENVYIPLIRRPAKKFLNTLANFLSGEKIPDLNSGMRGFKKSIVLNYFHVLPDKFSFTTTITVSMLAEGYKVGFIPINYYVRNGESKIKPSDFFNFFTLVIRVIYLFNPLRFFLILTFILLGLSLIKTVHDLFFYGFISASSIIGFILAAQSLFFGVTLDVIYFLNFRDNTK